MGAGFDGVGVGGRGEPVPVLVLFVALLPPVGAVVLTREKFAQVRRVLLAKCSVKEPFGKKLFEPIIVDVYSSVYDALKGSELMAPCLPAISPTWHVSGREESQGGACDKR
jgi:hypothetical protein